MKQLLSLISALLVFYSLKVAQWEVIHASGFTAVHSDLVFQNAATAYVWGAVSPFESHVLRTTNGGANWDSTHADDFSARSIHFHSADTGYISGFTDGGANLSVMRTINAGDT
jgi:photosystem II stability/assembly factor-like uncharacterized protein